MVLLDASILVRTEDRDSPDRDVCVEAVRTLCEAGTARLCAQVLIEFWAVVTRPQSVNGLGFGSDRADIAVGKLMTAIPVLAEPPDMAARWRGLAMAVWASGRQVHDTRIVALMHAHSVSRILTLNEQDFRRYLGIGAYHPSKAADLRDL